MNNTEDEPLALEAMLLSALSGEASAQELDLLHTLLSESEDLRLQASKFLYDDALLKYHSKTERERKDFAPKVGQGGEADAPLSTLASRSRRFGSSINRHGLAVAAIAMSLLLGLAGYTFTLKTKLDRLYELALVEGADGPSPNHWRSRRPNGRSQVEPLVLGRVAGLNNAVWKNEAARLAFGDRIELGQKLELESGVVELLLSSGAKVTIEGPAEFEATSALEANVGLGKIAAAAPRVARGYTILTPTAELVDIGTQFGVLVDEQGDSELHVFDGDVVARSRNAPSTQLMHARENEAMRFNTASATPERIEARQADFVRQLRPAQVDTDVPALPLADSLSIWYASDMCTEFAVDERVTVWRDILKSGNDFADDAWQFDENRAPTLMKDDAGRPALRFDGWSSYLATSPVQPQPQQTMCIVCLPAPNSYANDLQGQMLLKYGDVPSIELSLIDDRTIRGWVWAAGDRGNIAVNRGSQLATDAPSVIIYEYDSEANVSSLWVNGELRSTTDAPIAVLQPGRKFIGAHSDAHVRAKFFGALYEVAVFDKCFEAEEMESLWGYFTDRYDVP